MVVKFKVIKPRKFDVAPIREELKRAMDSEVKPTLLGDLQPTVKGWDDPAEFLTRWMTELKGTSVGMLFYTHHKVWNILNQGSPPHIIRAKNAPLLHFRVGPYTRKTTPKTLTSGPGGYASGPWVSKKEVSHPGTKPNEWYRTLIEKRRQWFKKVASEAMWRGLQKTGYAMKRK